MVDIDARVKDNDSSAFERINVSMRNYGITDLPTTVLINDDNSLIRKFIDFVETKEIESMSGRILRWTSYSFIYVKTFLV